MIELPWPFGAIAARKVIDEKGAEEKDLQAAGIPKYTPEGRTDFHACRVAYITFVIESGVTVKEAQVLARHKTPELTMNVYGRVRKDQLSQTEERLGETLLPQEQCVIYVYQDGEGGGKNPWPS